MAMAVISHTAILTDLHVCDTSSTYRYWTSLTTVVLPTTLLETLEHLCHVQQPYNRIDIEIKQVQFLLAC